MEQPLARSDDPRKNKLRAMDKKGFIHEHSKIKLELYKLYLERYLAVLLVAPYFDRIVIHDVFAGSGVSKNGENGSAVIAADVILDLSNSHNPKGKHITLAVNDSDKDNFLQLQKHLARYPFAEPSNLNAGAYIQKWSPIANGHNLFFLDPHGYTQVQFADLKKLFSTQSSDFLIFIPLHHIYRFLRKQDDAELKPLEEQLTPIANFLADLGVKETDAIKIDNIENFSGLITARLKEISGTNFVYKQIIDNQDRNSKYGLFFISHNILGAEKFLEAQAKLKKHIEDSKRQLAFSFSDVMNGASILDVLERGKAYDNTDLYKLGIMAGILPSELNGQLKKLEADNKIIVTALPGKQRNKGGFYLNYKNYKNKEKIISVMRT